MLRKLLFFIILFSAGCFCQDKAEILVNSINKDNLKNTKVLNNIIFEVHKAGKEAVPFLISRISDTTTVFNSLVNPLSSYIAAMKIPSGLVFAYIIDLLLAKDSLTSCRDTGFLFCNLKDYIYYNGVIYRKDNNSVAEKKDISLIKAVYQKWWNQYKDKDLTELKRMYKNNQGPLSNSIFEWR